MSLMVALRPGLMPEGFGTLATLGGAAGLGAGRGAAAFFRGRFMAVIVRKRIAYGQVCP
jgi:hypothetical protein